MIEKFLQALKCDADLQSHLRACEKHGSVSKEEIKALRELIILLAPFKMATDLFQKQYETVSLVIPTYIDIMTRCDKSAELKHCLNVAVQYSRQITLDNEPK